MRGREAVTGEAHHFRWWKCSLHRAYCWHRMQISPPPTPTTYTRARTHTLQVSTRFIRQIRHLGWRRGGGRTRFRLRGTEFLLCVPSARHNAQPLAVRRGSYAKRSVKVSRRVINLTTRNPCEGRCIVRIIVYRLHVIVDRCFSYFTTAGAAITHAHSHDTRGVPLTFARIRMYNYALHCTMYGMEKNVHSLCNLRQKEPTSPPPSLPHKKKEIQCTQFSPRSKINSGNLRRIRLNKMESCDLHHLVHNSNCNLHHFKIT